jgi:Spy/CpxP family protein refolding chaperone
MATKLKILTVGLALIALAGSAMAAGPGFGFDDRINRPFIEDRLNLTTEQKTKLKELQEKHWNETIALRNEMQTRRLELRTLWTVPNPDKNKILAKQKELNELRDKMQAKTTDFRLDMRKILTPEQAAQVGIQGAGIGFGRGIGRPWMGRPGPYGGPGRGAGCWGAYGAGPGFSQNRL